MNPFGLAITDEVLEAMSKYKGKIITQEDRAREAMNMIHSEDKNLEALKYVLNLKSQYGDGVSTLCLIYNATGDTLKIAQKQDWLGGVYEEEPPESFDNGQWLAFLHSHPTAQSLGSEAARVYRGKNIKGEVRDFFISWRLPWDSSQNSAYTEVREKDHFPKYWEDLRILLGNSRKISQDISDEHCTSTVSVGGTSTSEFIAVLGHKYGPLT